MRCSFRPTRRQFLNASAKAATAGAFACPLAISQGLYAAGSDVIRLGLIGCGGRGTGAVGQVLNVSRGVRLTAMGDLFQEKIETSLQGLRGMPPSQMDVSDERKFIGLQPFTGRGLAHFSAGTCVFYTERHRRKMCLTP